VRVLKLQPCGLQRVRAAQPTDSHLLAPLCAAHAEFERLQYNATDHIEHLKRALAGGQLYAWLLEMGGHPMGYASVTLDYSTLSARRFAHLDCLYLEEAARGQGGGRQLMGAVQAFAREKGCAELQWQTPHWNQQAMQFYDALGAKGVPKQRYVLSLAGAMHHKPSTDFTEPR
jgi:GNAT superfamily N-acetyltransferase